jgi:hypothetical protein
MAMNYEEELALARQMIEPIQATFGDVMRSLVHAPEPLPERTVTPSLAPWSGNIHCMDAVALMDELPAVNPMSCSAQYRRNADS